MNAPSKKIAPSVEDALSELQPQLTKLREPFPPKLISKLPKPTKKQTDEVKADFKKGIRCEVCGSWHHPDVVHLDYVGHAALTDRLLDTDLEWSWEPVGFTPEGLPALDRNGGLWIKLTVCGVTRYGYGAADGKSGGDAMKEMIGDALRNAAMRFGAALDLWHKGDLHADSHDPETGDERPTTGERGPRNGTNKTHLDGPYDTLPKLEKAAREFVRTLNGMSTLAEFDEFRDDKEVLAFVAQCKRDLPGWWFANHPNNPPDFTPLEALATSTRRGLAALESAE